MFKRYYFQNAIYCGNCNGSGWQGYADYCRCCSGTGIETLYQFFEHQLYQPDLITLHLQYSQSLNEVEARRAAWNNLENKFDKPFELYGKD